MLHDAALAADLITGWELLLGGCASSQPGHGLDCFNFSVQPVIVKILSHQKNQGWVVAHSVATVPTRPNSSVAAAKAVVLPEAASSGGGAGAYTHLHSSEEGF